MNIVIFVPWFIIEMTLKTTIIFFKSRAYKKA